MLLHNHRFVVRAMAVVLFVISVTPIGFFAWVLQLPNRQKSGVADAIFWMVIVLMTGLAAISVYVWRSANRLPPNATWPEDLELHPKRLSYKQQAGIVLISMVLLAYSVYGLAQDDILLPGKRSGLHLHGSAAWLMACSLVCASTCMLTPIIFQHFGSKSRAASYRNLATICKWVAWVSFVMSIVLAVTLRAQERAF
jgi:magnesium-transporting ATPase (P-type)